MSLGVVPDVQGHIERLKRIFNTQPPTASQVFSTPGYIDFFHASYLIGDRVEKQVLDIEGLKVLVLHFLDRGFFEPIFIVKRGKLVALKRHGRRDEIRLFPEYIWTRERYPQIRSDFLTLEKQLRVAKEKCLAELRRFDSLLEQLKASDAIIWLSEDEVQTEKKRKSGEWSTNAVWKVVVCQANAG